ncbi:hypothetical protein KC19_3G086700 [Ceratodon purpureus]|uniref:Uncharacterized protein n=1 Tax=Ceratodon purpureus TaxID=3225 RepID=A0A8T0IJ18_CERPU|nr:hypothetical protein KC19_3G086700 [Ceratodon purpureus]
MSFCLCTNLLEALFQVMTVNVCSPPEVEGFSFNKSVAGVQIDVITHFLL